MLRKGRSSLPLECHLKRRINDFLTELRAHSPWLRQHWSSLVHWIYMGRRGIDPQQFPQFHRVQPWTSEFVSELAQHCTDFTIKKPRSTKALKSSNKCGRWNHSRALTNRESAQAILCFPVQRFQQVPKLLPPPFSKCCLAKSFF